MTSFAMMTSTPGDRARRDRSCHPPSEPWPETLKGFRHFCGWTRPQTAPTWLQSAPQGLVAAFRIRVLSFAVARACTPPVGVKARLTPIRARSGGQDRRKISPLPWGRRSLIAWLELTKGGVSDTTNCRGQTAGAGSRAMQVPNLSRVIAPPRSRGAIRPSRAAAATNLRLRPTPECALRPSCARVPRR